jgi:hypothetical protein
VRRFVLASCALFVGLSGSVTPAGSAERLPIDRGLVLRFLSHVENGESKLAETDLLRVVKVPDIRSGTGHDVKAGEFIADIADYDVQYVDLAPAREVAIATFVHKTKGGCPQQPIPRISAIFSQSGKSKLGLRYELDAGECPRVYLPSAPRKE